MTSIANPFYLHFRLPRIRLPRLSGANHRRRRATIDLIEGSPHLKRDIGLLEEHFTTRHR